MSNVSQVRDYLMTLQDRITTAFEAMDGRATFDARELTGD